MVDSHIHSDNSSNAALTVSEVAEQLRTTPRTVQRWIKDGRLRAFRLPGGRSYRIYEADVAAALTVTVAS